MKLRTPYYFKDFKCIASKCTDTCCAGWEIIIDDESYNKYKKVSTDFGKRLNSEIILYEDNEPGFTLKNGNCAFLNKNLLCDIYSELGEEALCHTCKTFPRIVEEYGSLRETCISLACPEAARLILKDSTKVTFDNSENDEFVTTYNEISPELYIHIINARETAYKIIQNSSLSIRNRMVILLCFASDIQEKMDDLELSQITEVIKDYSNEEFINDLLESYDYCKNKADNKYNIVLEYMNSLKEFENINDKWPKYIDDVIHTFYDKNDVEFHVESHKNFDEYYTSRNYEFKNLLMYFTFRYFMKSLLDADLLSKVKLSIMSYIIIKELDVVTWMSNGNSLSLEDQIEITHTYSKQFEHSDINIDKLYDMYNEMEIFDVEHFITLLFN